MKQAITRSLVFRFDYFLRSLPIDALGRRCEQLMRAAEKEVAHLEKEVREFEGLPTEPENEGDVLPPVTIPPFFEMKKRRILSAKTKAEEGRKELAAKVEDVAAQIKARQEELKALTHGTAYNGPSFNQPSTKSTSKREPEAPPSLDPSEDDSPKGAEGPDGEYVPFPEYDGSSEPVDWKKPFGQYCARKRKSVKATLSDEERNDKVSQRHGFDTPRLLRISRNYRKKSNQS